MNYRFAVNIVLYAVLSVIFFGCGSVTVDEKLRAISMQIEENPRKAIIELEKLSPQTLSESDRYFRNLLIIKSKDKAYVTHSSDSLVLDVIEYYKKSTDKSLYPEALYYGGRVYSDMCDYRTALAYFNEALKLLPIDTDNIELRACIISQTGRLLHTMRMYSQAMPYLEESLRIDIRSGIPFNIAYSHQLLGINFLDSKNYEKA
ncbi:MAG: hypothetical protein K1W41_23170 [Lachnospiraceae bacterium]|mgnify:CR=1